jgi:hypothetical protein
MIPASRANASGGTRSFGGYAFDETSDAIREIAEVPERNIVGIAAARGRLFVAVNSKQGSLYEIDPANGKVVLFKRAIVAICSPCVMSELVA